MDFDDLLVYTYILFRDYPEVLARYQDQFRYILVDEYQDTNYAQHSIVLQLTKENQHVCVVGDDAQSIYSFRGADIDNILYFTKTYPNTKVFKLEQNYRSTQTIVCAANSLIEKNERQIRKAVFSEKEKGEAIGVFQAYSDVEEGDIVANKVAELRREYHYGYADFAILYRTNAQSRIFEEALRKRSMPYKIYGGLSFYQRKEIKDVIAYFRLVVNPNEMCIRDSSNTLNGKFELRHQLCKGRVGDKFHLFVVHLYFHCPIRINKLKVNTKLSLIHISAYLLKSKDWSQSFQIGSRPSFFKSRSTSTAFRSSLT